MEVAASIQKMLLARKSGKSSKSRQEQPGEAKVHRRHCHANAVTMAKAKVEDACDPKAILESAEEHAAQRRALTAAELYRERRHRGNDSMLKRFPVPMAPTERAQ